MALALLAMVTVVAPIAGPILGGWITDNYTWPWIFFINMPIGIFAWHRWWRSQLQGATPKRSNAAGSTTSAWHAGHRRRRAADHARQGQRRGLVQLEPSSWSLAIIAAIGFAVFLIWELTDKHPIVDLRLFRHRNFSAGTLALVLAYAAFFGIGLLVPLWLQRNLGYTATWAGFATAPIGMLPVLLTPFVGKYAIRFDLRVLATRRLRGDGRDLFHARGLQPRRRLLARGRWCSCCRAWAWRCSSCRC